MRFFSKTSSACAVAMALAVMAAGVQAQGLKTTGKASGSDQSVTRALNATGQTFGKTVAPAANGIRSADYIVAVVNSEPITNSDVRARMVRVAQNVTEQGGQLPP